jgi:hypothetical protein
MRNAPIVQTFSNVSTKSGPHIYAPFYFAVSVQATQGDSSAAGTVKLQASNDFSQAANIGNFQPTNWSDIPGATATVTAGATVLIPYTQLSYGWIRAVWTETTPGTSMITLNIAPQGL